MASLELIDRISERHLGLLSAYSSDLAFQQNKATLLGLVNSVVNTTRSCSLVGFSELCPCPRKNTCRSVKDVRVYRRRRHGADSREGSEGRLWEEKNLAEEEERIFSQRETKRTEFGKPGRFFEGG